MSVCLSVCLCVSLFCLSFCLSVYLSVCLCVCMYVCMHACMHACMPACLSVCMFFSMSKALATRAWRRHGQHCWTSSNYDRGCSVLKHPLCEVFGEDVVPSLRRAPRSDCIVDGVGRVVGRRETGVDSQTSGSDLRQYSVCRLTFCVRSSNFHFFLNSNHLVLVMVR